MQSIKIQTSQNIEVEYMLAGVGDRLVAFLVDLAIFITYIVAIILLNSEIQFISGQFRYLTAFLIYLPITFYSLLSEVFMNGQTVGKKAKGIQVISLDGGQATFGQYIIRWLFGLLDKWMLFGMIGVIMIALSELNQRLGDKVAGTVVVRNQHGTAFTETIFMETPEIYQPLYPQVVQLTERDISLIREVLNRNTKLPNYELIMKTANKIKSVLQIVTTHESQDFLYTVLKDYNHITSRI
ncbi:MAG: RDD family protein [Gemmatimonadaceae bacterium]|nr:RDD family protein [Chitinophagaceae bacterium]